MPLTPKKFVPVMLTPFKENGKVDYEGLSALIDFYLEAGVSGLFANCQSGEMYFLTPEERLAVVRHVVRRVGGRVPVVAAGTFSSRLEKQIEEVKNMYDTGIEAVIAITSILASQQESDQVFEERMQELLNKTPGVLFGFYECPEPYKRVLSAELLREFVSTGRVIYHKDTSLSLPQIKEKLKATKNFPAFGLFDAYMGHAVASLKAGAAGLSCIQGNYFPELIVWLCKHYGNPEKKKEVDRVQQFLIDQMEAMHQNYPVLGKLYLQQHRGLPIQPFARDSAGIRFETLAPQLQGLAKEYSLLKSELGE